MGRMVSKLGDASRVELEWVVKRSENWRERERAQTLLLLDQGVFAQEVAHQLGVNVRTVGTRRAAGGLKAGASRWATCRAAARRGS